MNQNELAIMMRAYDQFTSTFARLRQATHGVTQAEREMQMASDGVNRSHRQLVQSSQQVTQSHQHVKRATDGVAHSHNQMLQTMGSLGILFALQRGLVAIANAGGELEDRLLRLRAITNEATDDARRSVMESTGSRFGPGRQSEALVDMGAAGLTAAQSLKALPPVMDFATAAQIQLQESAEATLIVLRTYQLEAEHAAHVTDAFTVAANKSALQGEDLHLALAMSAAGAKLAGRSLEELLTTLAILRDAGLRASDAGTSIKSALISLMSPSKEARDIMRQLGIQIYDNEGRMKSWSEVIGEFEKGLAGLDEQSRQYAMTTLFGTDGIRAASLTIDRGSKFVAQMTRELEMADGATRSVAATMDDSFRTAVDRTSGNLERMGATLFEDIKPALTLALRLFNDFVLGVMEIPQPIRRVVTAVIGSGGLVLALRTLKATLQELHAWMGLGAVLKGAAAGAAGATATTVAAAQAARAASVSIMGARYASTASGLLVPAGMAAAGGVAAGGAAAGGTAIAGLAGPIGIAVAALAMLIPMYVTYLGHQKEVARQERENRQEVLALAEQYESLKGQGEDTSIVVQRLGQLMPSLTAEVDKQGNAIAIADDKLKSLVERYESLAKQELVDRLAALRREIEAAAAAVTDAEFFRNNPQATGLSAEGLAAAQMVGSVEETNRRLEELTGERRRILSQLGKLKFGDSSGENPDDYLDPNRALGDQWRPDGGPGYPGTKTLNTGGSGDTRTPLEIALDKAAEMIRIRDLQKALVEGTSGEAGAQQALLAEYAKAVDLAAQNVEAMAAAHGEESEQALKATVRLLELRKAVKDLQDQTRGGGADIRFDNAALMSVHTEQFLAGLQNAQIASSAESKVVIELRDVTGNLQNLSPDDWAQLKTGVSEAIARLLQDGLFAQGIGHAQGLLIVR